MYSFQFIYNRKGRGELQLLQDGTVIRGWLARCGSIDAKGQLVNATPEGTYKILENAALTDNEAMQIGGIGWWCRLYKADGEKTSLGIHPDGGKGGRVGNGTAGCIGTQELDLPLMERINEIRREQYQILVEVRQEI